MRYVYNTNVEMATADGERKDDNVPALDVHPTNVEMATTDGDQEDDNVPAPDVHKTDVEMATMDGYQKDDNVPFLDVHITNVEMVTTDGERKYDNGHVQESSDSKDGFQELYMVLNSMGANLDQLAENCCSVNDRMNQLEIECIDLLKPIGDIISLERELKRLIEVESNYMAVFKCNENNINPQEPI